MPTYEYECERCKRAFEVEQKISEPVLTTCPLSVQHTVIPTVVVACNGPVKRLIAGSTTFVLKGERWFKDGY